MDLQKYYGYEDVFIIPNYSNVLTRNEVSTDVTLGSKERAFTLKIPIISANMDTITENRMINILNEKGASGALHRFMSIEDNVKEFNKVINPNFCFVSIGTNSDYKDRAKALYDAGALNYIVDIAHGHSLMMKNTVEWLRKEFKNKIMIMAGNVTTPEAVQDLESWNVDAIKVGIGPGSVCLTKDVTGVTMPIFSAIQNCSNVSRVPIIADGGCKAYGDVAKAIGAGATAVMSGYFFSGTDEIPEKAWRIDNKNQQVPIYRGMASSEAMKTIRKDNLPTPEGKSILVERKGSAGHIVEQIAGGLRSSYSYVGATNTREFQAKVKFGLKR